MKLSTLIDVIMYIFGFYTWAILTQIFDKNTLWTAIIFIGIIPLGVYIISVYYFKTQEKKVRPLYSTIAIVVAFLAANALLGYFIA